MRKCDNIPTTSKGSNSVFEKSRALTLVVLGALIISSNPCSADPSNISKALPLEDQIRTHQNDCQNVLNIGLSDGELVIVHEIALHILDHAMTQRRLKLSEFSSLSNEPNVFYCDGYVLIESQVEPLSTGSPVSVLVGRRNFEEILKSDVKAQFSSPHAAVPNNLVCYLSYCE